MVFPYVQRLRSCVIPRHKAAYSPAAACLSFLRSQSAKTINIGSKSTMLPQAQKANCVSHSVNKQETSRYETRDRETSRHTAPLLLVLQSSPAHLHQIARLVAP